MKVSSYWFWDLPRNLPRGIYVVIDIWGMTTNLSSMLKQKPKKIIITNEKQIDTTLKEYTNSLLVGESETHKLDFFISNFVSEVAATKFRNKIIAYSTSNGTKVFERLRNQELVIGCAFNNIDAVSKFLKQFDKRVNIIKAGRLGIKVIEDQLGSEVLINKLLGKRIQWQTIKDKLNHVFLDNYSHEQKIDKSKMKQELTIIFQVDYFQTIPASKVNKKGHLEIYELKH